MIDLSGRIVIVTGGNSGIGLGIAPGVARAGASVAIWSRRAERNAEAVAELEGLGATAIGAQCDVSDEDNVAGAMRETLDRLRPPRLPGRQRRDDRQAAVHGHDARRVAPRAAR